ncbi:lasso peptide biosynthesis PqqD family chaperone [Streptomyces sp. NPDC059256]|uniref:lasso peptide biosynthesis PqqD family chaperone n=1 Tax=Streptomyces sp. NPDC059256 TaxID=3346794 RepID=UPI0036B688D0
MKLAPAVHATETDTGMVLLDERSGRYWQLNPTGALILRTLLDGDTADDAARQLHHRHPGLDADQAGRDVTALVNNLLASGLVTS